MFAGLVQKKYYNSLVNKSVLLPILVILLALCPSIADIYEGHRTGSDNLPVLWGWVGLALIVAFVAGEDLSRA